MSGIELANIAAKLALYLGTILAAGSPLLRLSVAPAAQSGAPDIGVFDAWLIRQTVFGIGLATFAVVALYGTRQLQMAGGDLSLAFAPDFVGIGLQTAVGQSGIVTLAGAAVLILALIRRRKWLGAIGAIVMVGAFTLQGHSMSIPLDAGWPMVGRLTLSTILLVHLVIASWWFAVLIPLQTAQGEERNQAAICFGEWALRAVPVLLLAGAVLFLSITQFQIDFSDPYQQRMALKVAVVSAVLAIAALNKIWLTGKPGLLWSLRFETLAAFAVLGATAWLTATGPGMN